MNADAAWERYLALAEEERHHGYCCECGFPGEYGGDLLECDLCGRPVHDYCKPQHDEWSHDILEEEQ